MSFGRITNTGESSVINNIIRKGPRLLGFLKPHSKDVFPRNIGLLTDVRADFEMICAGTAPPNLYSPFE